MSVQMLLNIFSFVVALMCWIVVAKLDHQHVLEGHPLTCKYSLKNDERFRWHLCRSYWGFFALVFVLFRLFAWIGVRQ